ncbi:UDP-N-acetylglucosamine 2-epimerase [bacterium]|nr:UDP-N-acetylglucosamine 2-epimerase [bacterium]
MKDKISKSDLMSWYDEVIDILKKSNWSTSLYVDDICILDVSRLHVVLRLLGEARAKSGTHESRISLFTRMNTKIKQRINRKLILENYKYSKIEKNHYDILYYAVEFNHINMQIPVYRKLEEKGVSGLFITHKPEILFALRKLKIPAIIYTSYFKKTFGSSEAQLKSFKNTLNLELNAELPELESFDGQDEIVKFLRRQLVQLFPLVYENIKTIGSVLESTHPKLLVPGYSISLYGYILCSYGKKLNIPSNHIQQGAVSGNPIYRYSIADLMLVHGEMAKNSLLDMGFEEERIAICGNPQIDRIAQQSRKMNDLIVSELNLNREKPYILVLTSGAGDRVSIDHHKKIISEIRNAAKANPDMQFVVKLHRKDSMEYYLAEDESNQYGKLIVAPKSLGLKIGSIFEWLQGCNAVITGASTAGMEAMLLDVPVITIDLNNEISGIPYIDYGASIHLNDAGKLSEVVQQFVNNPTVYSEVTEKASQFLKLEYGELDGKASDRIADKFLEQMDGTASSRSQ